MKSPLLNPRRCFTALILGLCSLSMIVAEPPSEYGSNGGPIPKGIKYAGPIVYTNEKPPIIHFPPPPKNAGFGSGWGPNQLKYIPMPHHDLPVLIYQSDSNPPIHVVSPPAQGHHGPPKVKFVEEPKVEYGYPSNPSPQYGAPQGQYGVPSQISGVESYGVPPKYGPPSNSFSSASEWMNYGPPAPPPQKTSHKSYSESEWMPGPPPGFKHEEYMSYSHHPPPPPPRKRHPPAPHIFYRGHPPIHVMRNIPEVPKVQFSYAPSQEFSGTSSLSSFYGKPEYGIPSSRGSKMITIQYGAPKGSLSSHYGSQGPLSHSPPSYGQSASQSSSYQDIPSPPSNSYAGSYGSASSHSTEWMEGPPPGWSSNDNQIYNKFEHRPAPKQSFLSSMIPRFVSSSQGPRISFPYKQRSKYVIAPKAWHKPPIIIYAGVKPPVHVYKKTEDSQNQGWSSSSSVDAPVSSGSTSSSSDGYGPSSAANQAADNVDITYGAGSSSSAGEVYLPSASAPRPTIIKPPTQSSALKTIYVSNLISSGSNDQYKTFLVTNTSPVEVKNIGYTSPNLSPPAIESSYNSFVHDLDTAASSILSRNSIITRNSGPIQPVLREDDTENFRENILQKANMIHEHVAESRILPSDPESIFRSYRTVDNSEVDSVENASVSVPLSLIVPTSTESSENFSSTNSPSSTETSSS